MSLRHGVAGRAPMRLKVKPDDFRVRELLDYEQDPRGEHYVHRLRKEKLDTLQALTELARVTGVSRSDIAFAGLKDRQGVTEQWISVRGRRLEYRRRDLEVTFDGRAREPISSKQSRGNAFEIVMRELGDEELDSLQERLLDIRATGFVNYFDDQRFGCVRHGQGFILRDVLRGDYESALRALIATPSPKAITGDVKLKRILRDKWGDWEVCASVARGPSWQRVFNVLLRNERDFKGALAALPERQKLIHAFAYQSYLWNRALSRWLRMEVPRESAAEIWTVLGRLRAWRRLPPGKAARVAGIDAPMFGVGLAGGEPSYRAALDAVLRREEVTVQDCEEHGLPGLQLRTELRPTVVIPEDVRLGRVQRERTSRSLAATLAFSLPRGAYATMLIKCLTSEPWGSAQRRDRPAGRDRDERDDES